MRHHRVPGIRMRHHRALISGLDAPSPCPDLGFPMRITDNVRIVQVHTHGVRVLAGELQAQEVSTSTIIGGTSSATMPAIVDAVVQDPYVVVRLASGQTALLVGDATSRLLAPCPAGVSLLRHEVTAVALYADNVSASRFPWASRAAGETSTPWLHRHLGAEVATGSKPVLMLVCFKGGRLHVYQLPSLKLVFACNRANHGRQMLVDEGNNPEPAVA
ncbi:hypothetical protein CYMTET_34602, partial [Cymbomonas tetramitiformis]